MSLPRVFLRGNISHGGMVRMKQTKGAIGNLLNRYRAVLKKCHLLNTFGSLAVASILCIGSATDLHAASFPSDNYILTEDIANTQYTIEAGESQIIDLNGHNISILTDGSTIRNEGQLIINDIDNSGKISSSFENTKGDSVGIFIISEKENTTSRLIVNGGSIYGTAFGISGNGNPEFKGETFIEINCGLVESGKGTAIFNPQKGIVNINKKYL